MSGRKRGFTLVELLVVIGIIALLIGILMPVLGKARDSANRTACLSNMRQLGMAFVMYTGENKGAFPYNTSFARPGNRLAPSGGSYPAQYGKNLVKNFDFVDPSGSGTDYGPHPEDWIYWQTENPPAYRDISESAIGKYLGGNGNREAMEKLMRCPTDTEVMNRVNGGAAPGEGPYRFSYTMNANISFRKITEVRNSSNKLLLVEENYANDGRWAPSTTSSADALSVRHGNAPIPAGYPTAGPQVNGKVAINIPAAFVDGHGEIIDQMYANDDMHYALTK